MHIKDVITLSELEEVFHEFLEDQNANLSNGSEVADRQKGTIDRLGYHAFLRWVLHYLFMLGLTDMCDDHRFMFSHLDQLVRKLLNNCMVTCRHFVLVDSASFLIKLLCICR